MGQTVHVYRSEKGWAVKREGRKPSHLFSTQREAVANARRMMRDSAPSQMVVYGKNGLIKDYAVRGLPKVQNPPGKRRVKIEKAVAQVALERFASDPNPPRG